MSAVDPGRARLQRPLGGGDQARRRRGHRRHLGPRPAPRLAPARADRRAGAVRARGRRRAHGAAAVGAERRPTGGAPASRRPSPRVRRGRPACTSSGRRPTRCCGASSTSRPTATGSRWPPLPDRWVVVRLLTPVGATTAAVRGWVLEADRAVRVELADWPAGSADGDTGRRDRRTRRAHRHRGRRADVGGDVRLGREPLRPPRSRSTTSRRSPPTASPATPPPTWWRAGGPTRHSTRSTPPTTPTASTSCCTHSAGARSPRGSTRPPTSVSQDDVAQRRAAVNLTSANRFVLDPNDQPPTAPPIVERPVTDDDEPGPLDAGRQGVGRVLHHTVVAARHAAPRQRLRRAAPATRPGPDRRQPALGRRGAGRARQPRRRRDRCAGGRGLRDARPTRRGGTPSGSSARSPGSCCASSARPTAPSRWRSTSTTSPSARFPAASGATTGSWPGRAACR